MAEKEKEVKEVKKAKSVSKKVIEKSNEVPPAFETRKDIKKLVLYTVIVSRGQGDNIIRIFKANKSSAQFLQFGRGTYKKSFHEIFDIEDTEKDIVYSLVREDVVPEIKKELDILFANSKKHIGIAYTINLTSIVGVKLYKFFTQTVRG